MSGIRAIRRGIKEQAHETRLFHQLLVTFYEFNRTADRKLDFEGQRRHAKYNATWLMSRSDDVVFVLYALGSFYVELEYSLDNKRVAYATVWV